MRKKSSVVVDDVHLYGCPVVRTLTLSESLAISRLTGYEPKQVPYRVHERLCCSSLYLTSSEYKTCNRHCDDTVQLKDGQLCTVLSCVVGTLLCSCSDACYCADSVLLVVNLLDKITQHSLFWNSKLSVSSDAFLSVTKRSAETSCVMPADVSRKCYRFADGTINYVVPVPTKTESD